MNKSRQVLNYILSNIEQCYVDLDGLTDNIIEQDELALNEYRIKVETRLETLNDILKYWHYIEGSPL